MSDTEHAFQELTKHLAHEGYIFVCPSPETQGRVVEKRKSNTSTADANNAADVFGWNLSISQKRLDTFLPQPLKETLAKASILVPAEDNNFLRSTIRVSNFYPPEIPDRNETATPLYYIHSSFPAASDSVFFGPDTYLFTSFLRHATRHLQQAPTTIIDVCCGSGAGAIHMARTFPQARNLGLDLNPQALKYGAVNARLAGATVEFLESNLYASVPSSLHESGGVDLIVSNPPYIASSLDGKDLPVYADGGANFGLDISMRIVEEGRDILSR
ncbi:S-adenosyl-L-methionine-dependent methyltransferase, partial [Periconia macrospinosa]